MKLILKIIIGIYYWKSLTAFSASGVPIRPNALATRRRTPTFSSYNTCIRVGTASSDPISPNASAATRGTQVSSSCKACTRSGTASFAPSPIPC